MGFPLSAQCEVGHFGASAMDTPLRRMGEAYPTGASADTREGFGLFVGLERCREPARRHVSMNWKRLAGPMSRIAAARRSAVAAMSLREHTSTGPCV